MKFCADFHDSKKTNPDDFGEPLTFSLAPPAGQRFYLSCEMAQY